MRDIKLINAVEGYYKSFCLFVLFLLFGMIVNYYLLNLMF